MSLALRLQPVADGSDMMGSLRNPAAWDNVFGLRPSQGRVPYNAHAGDCYVAQLGTEGPMGRTVRDVAMLLSVQAGHDARQPLSIAQDGSAFARPLQPAARGLRIGWLADLDGHLPFEPGILPLCESALRRFEALGARVEPLSLGYPCDEVWQTWLAWRRFLVAGNLAAFGADPEKHARLKPEAQWEYDQGQGLSGPEVYAASLNRTRFYRHMVSLFERFDLLVLPSAQVWPFPAEWTWPREVAGRTMDTYHRWMEVVIYATLAGLPALSVPVGFNDAGLPMGMQLIGPPLGDLAVLNAAAAYEQTIPDLLARRPVLGLNPAPAPRRVLPVIVLAQLAGTSPWFAVNAVMPDLQREFGWAAADVGTLTSAVQLGFIAGTLVFALLAIADRFSPRRVFLLCSLAGAACTLAGVWSAGSFHGLLLWRVLTGFFLAGIYPVGMKIASLWFPQGLGAALGWLIGALVLGSASAHAVRAAGAALAVDRGVPHRRRRRRAGRAAAVPGRARTAARAGPRQRPAVARAGQHLDRPQGARLGARLLRPHVGAVHDVGAGAGDPGHAPGRRGTVLGGLRRARRRRHRLHRRRAVGAAHRQRARGRVAAVGKRLPAACSRPGCCRPAMPGLPRGCCCGASPWPAIRRSSRR